MRVAYFSPLPPDTSGIADYSALLLPALERLIDVEVVRPGRTRPIASADVALYHVGNNPDAHGWIVDALRRRPGVVVLHEYVLHHLVAGITIGRRDGHAYLDAMEREAGSAGRMLAWGVLEGRLPALWEVRPTEFPLVSYVLDRATGVIVHSRFVEEQARAHGYAGPVWRVPHPAWPVPDVPAEAIAGEPLIGCFGHLNESKRIPQLLAAFARFRERRPGARLLLVGPEAPGFDLDGRLRRLGLDATGVIRHPYVEERRLWSLMSACDAVVQLRMPTMGETSGGAIRALTLAKPLVVSDVGWFAELPDEVALKVGAGGIETALEQLAEPAVRARMSAAAERYVRAEHDLEHVAERYAAVLEESAGAAAVDALVLREVARPAADVELDPDALAVSLAEAGAVTGAPGVVASRRRVQWTLPPLVALVALYCVAVAVQLVLAVRVVSPWIFVDELVYSDMARSFADTGHFLIRGVPAGYGFVYPLLLSPIYRMFGSIHDVYQSARGVNAVVMVSVVFPVYLLARRVLREPASLAVAALSVALPSLVYVGTLMTENVFYPVFAWVAYALVLALERPTPRRQLVVLALCVLAFVTRAQAVAVVGAVLLAPLVLTWIERGRPGRLRAWAPLYGIVAGGGILVIVVQLARGHSPSDVLGGYSVTTGTSYAWWPSLRWIVYHLAALDLALWVLPFAAFVLVVANARHLDARMRAFAAAAVSLTLLLLVQVGLFASQFSERIEERNLFYLAPLFLIALLAWIERGQPRPARATVAAAGLAAALPGALPFTSLMNINAQSDTPFIQPWWYLGDELAGRENVGLVAVAVAIALSAAFLWLSRRYAPLLPVLVAAGFLLTWLPLQLWTHSFPRLSAGAYSTGIGPDVEKDWVDRTVGRDADVAVVWTGDNPYRGWELEFWNRSIRRVYDLGDSTLSIPSAEPKVTPSPMSGVLTDGTGPLHAQYVLAEPATRIVGTPLAEDTEKSLVLYEVRGPVRVGATTRGRYPDGWIGPGADWRLSGCTGGSLRIMLRSDAFLFRGLTQHVTLSGTVQRPRRIALAPGASKTVTIGLVPDAGRCDVHIGTELVRRPADFPALHNSDNRLLGVLVDSFAYVPGADG